MQFDHVSRNLKGTVSHRTGVVRRSTCVPGLYSVGCSKGTKARRMSHEDSKMLTTSHH